MTGEIRLTEVKKDKLTLVLVLFIRFFLMIDQPF